MLPRYSMPACFLCIFVSLQVAANGLQPDEIEKFRLECWSNPDYDVELKFAPVRRITGESRSEGRWSYEFTGAEQQYSDGRVKLPLDGAARVDLVTQLNRKDSDIDEGYLWSVIVAPKVKNWRFGAHWPLNRPITGYHRLAGKRESLIQAATLSVYNSDPVHSRISPKDIDSAGTLNSAWENLYGEKIVSRLVYPASKSADGYSLTFYYVPTPALRLINEEGYRWPSFKHVDREGSVYGFLLKTDGECIAATSIQVVR